VRRTIRRAILLRSAPVAHAGEIFRKVDSKVSFANINEDLILAFLYAHNYVHGALVQIASSAEMLLINMDTLLIEQDSIPDIARCGVLEPESTEVELPLANAMHQLDA
jgi:hypothetical protein